MRSAKHKPSRGVWGHAPPRKFVESKHPEIESEAIFRYFDANSSTNLLSVLKYVCVHVTF